MEWYEMSDTSGRMALENTMDKSVGLKGEICNRLVSGICGSWSNTLKHHDLLL